MQENYRLKDLETRYVLADFELRTNPKKQYDFNIELVNIFNVLLVEFGTVEPHYTNFKIAAEKYFSEAKAAVQNLNSKTKDLPRSKKKSLLDKL